MLQDLGPLAGAAVATEVLNIAPIGTGAIMFYGAALAGGIEDIVGAQGVYYGVLGALAAAVYAGYGALALCATALVVYGARPRRDACQCTGAIVLWRACSPLPRGAGGGKCAPQHADMHAHARPTPTALDVVNTHPRNQMVRPAWVVTPQRLSAGYEVVTNLRSNKLVVAPAALVGAAGFAVFRYARNSCSSCAGDICIALVLARLVWAGISVARDLID